MEYKIKQNKTKIIEHALHTVHSKQENDEAYLFFHFVNHIIRQITVVANKI